MSLRPTSTTMTSQRPHSTSILYAHCAKNIRYRIFQSYININGIKLGASIHTATSMDITGMKGY
jgi:hypothetical protein